MTQRIYAPLPERAIIEVGGDERTKFLNGLLSNDVARVDAGHALWAALLTAQGKFLHEMFVSQPAPEFLWLECEAARADDLLTRLKRYRLRAPVTLALRPDLAVVATDAPWPGLDDTPGTAMTLADGVALVDPRLPGLGCRVVLPAATLADTLAAAGFSPGDHAAFEHRRLDLGVPDGSRDLEVEKGTLMESGFAELHGIDFKKGCFVGQELTARMKWRGLAKKRLVPVRISGPLPVSGTPLTAADGSEAGEIRSTLALGKDGGLGLALVRLEYLDGAPLACGEATISARRPAWLALPQPKD